MLSFNDLSSGKKMNHVYLNIVSAFSHNIKILSCCQNHCGNISKETGNSFF